MGAIGMSGRIWQELGQKQSGVRLSLVARGGVASGMTAVGTLFGVLTTLLTRVHEPPGRAPL